MEKTKLQTDFEIFNNAIEFAKKRGYIVPPLEWAVLVKGGRDMGWSTSIRMWAVGLVYTEPFLKAFFGTQKVRRVEDNELMYAITMWAKQVAYEHEGRLYAADRDKPCMIFPTQDNIDYWAGRAPTELLEIKTVVKQLQDMTASLSIRTHKVSNTEVRDVTPEIPLYKFCLRQMTEYDNPFTYLKEYMEKQKGVS